MGWTLEAVEARPSTGLAMVGWGGGLSHVALHDKNNDKTNQNSVLCNLHFILNFIFHIFAL